jgi:hypothetical protein
LLTFEDAPDRRRSVLKEFNRGALSCLVNLTLFSEGTDLPNVRNVLIGRPTRSEVLFAQMVGRGLRGPAVPGGTDTCTVIVFHEQVLNLASQIVTTGLTESRAAFAALGCDELIADPEQPDRAPQVDVEVAQSPPPTRDPDGLRQKMQAVLAVLAGQLPPPTRVRGTPLTLI